MSTIETIREQSEIWSAFASLPDEAAIGADLAAVFLGMGTKTLARLRQNGGSPPYVQYREGESVARNQRVIYILADLRAWREANKVNSSMHAAKVRGLTFSSLGDLLEEQPFWQRTLVSKSKGGMGRAVIDKERDMIVGHAQTVSDSEFELLLHDSFADIVWLPVASAMNQPWFNAESRQVFHRAYVGLLQNLIAQDDRQQEKTLLGAIQL